MSKNELTEYNPEYFLEDEDWLEDEGLNLIRGWAREGYSIRDIAHRSGVGIHKLEKWRRTNPEFAKALRQGREVIDYKVESALLKSALGYKTKEVTVIAVLKNGKMVEVQRQTVTKEVAPNVTSCTTWLYNRMPDKWKNMNNRSNIIDELKEEDSDISITVTRASKDNNKTIINNPSDSEEEQEWQESVNKSVTLRRKTEEEKKKEREEKRKAAKLKKQQELSQSSKLLHFSSDNQEEVDLDYWPDDWEDED